MEDSMNFHDKVVLVAGGTGGLGREVTMAFLEAGAAVVATYRRAEEFAALDYGAGGALYAASKAGALALFDSLAAEVKPYNINVNSVLPSIIDTAANRKAMPGADFSKWPKPEEIARVILFLCSEEARVIHGAAIPVYGKT